MSWKDMHKLCGLFSLVFFSNSGLIFKPGELLNTRSAGLAEPTFPGSSSQQRKTINLLQMLV